MQPVLTPLARLATALGLVADLVSEKRHQPRSPEALDDAAARETTVMVLSWASVSNLG
jgi:hypothetical protein